MHRPEGLDLPIGDVSMIHGRADILMLKLYLTVKVRLDLWVWRFAYVR